MESDSRRRSVKVIRVLCDGCERASATAYCTACNECACSACTEHLHVRGQRSTKRPAARTCRGRYMRDLEKSVGVLALCTACRSRPAHRYGNGKAYAHCQECRGASRPPNAGPADEAGKRNGTEDTRRSSKSTSSGASSSVAGSSGARRRQKQHYQQGHHRLRWGRSSMEDDSTGDDITGAYSPDSSAG